MVPNPRTSRSVRVVLILVLLAATCNVQNVFAAPLTVMNINDSGPGSLRQAILDAAPGDTINFDSSLAAQTIFVTTTLVINKDLTIDGSALSSRLSISGNNSVRIFFVNSGIGFEINSLIIRNGQTNQNGAGIYNDGGTLTVVNSTFSENISIANPYVVGLGEGAAIFNNGDLGVFESTFNDNSASRGGAIRCSAGTTFISDSTFASNHALSDSAGDGGAIFDNCDSVVVNSTFTSNTAAHMGGALFSDNDIDPIGVGNSTFYNNTAPSGGGIANSGRLVINNSTFSNNNSSDGGALRNGLGGILTLANSILANSVGSVDCTKSDSTPVVLNINNLIESTGIGLESCGPSLLTSDPLLDSLQNNGGLTRTMALLPGSPAINAGDDETCEPEDQRGVSRPQWTHCDIGAYEVDKAYIQVNIAGNPEGLSSLSSQQSDRQSYDGVDDGPLKVVSTTASPLVASLRVNLKKNSVYSSYSEFMGLPASKLTDTYLFPWYNNATAGGLSSQLRFGNVGNATTTVTIKIGGVIQPQTFPLDPNESARVTLGNIDNGPVEVKSSGGVPIIASMRINLKNGMGFSSYSEFMGLSASSTAGTKYMFPWYNNATAGGLSSQLRFGNVGNDTTTVTIEVGGLAQAQTYTLAPNESARVEIDNLDSGPVEVSSSGGVPIIASMRVNLKPNPTYSSYSEFMGLPGATLTETRYLFPWYNNATSGGLSSQLRFGNVGNAITTVTIKIAGVAQLQTYTLVPNESARVTLNNIDSGPIEVVSSNNVPIIASMRVNLKSGVGFSSYSEFIGLSVGSPLGLPGNELSTTYWFPWYNNATNGGLSSQVRFGVP